jgi:hypothetical protein
MIFQVIILTYRSQIFDYHRREMLSRLMEKYRCDSYTLLRYVMPVRTNFLCSSSRNEKILALINLRLEIITIIRSCDQQDKQMLWTGTRTFTIRAGLQWNMSSCLCLQLRKKIIRRQILYCNSILYLSFCRKTIYLFTSFA